MEKEISRKELKVSAIENGTVIDHIPSGSVFQVIKILSLTEYQDQLLIATNLDSQKMGKKGIIKVSNRFFQPDEINKIALVAPSATLIVIRNFEVTEKTKVEVPRQVDNIVKCFNPNCITNNEDITTRFTVLDKKELKLRCHYCEKITARSNIAFR
ncbi:MAG TPA: aspartate carbamoyltransferase regulatory subunit [Bacteroidales bacterium]|nr:aspartate carbamoyltransferase regulatory subunit [Bacteroidales bacterium]HPS62106.1 aspartate carbamoyltransferase regulatory subunit [Bacteroidales bacterium]